MATTLNAQTLEAFRFNNLNNLKAEISTYLLTYLESKGIFSLDEFAQSPNIDLTDFKKTLTGDTDLKGLQIFAPYCQQLILPVLANGVLSQGGICINGFNSLRKLSSNYINGSGNYQAFYGNFSGCTNLTHIDFTASTLATNSPFVLPTLSANANLVSVDMLGSTFPNYITLANVGNLQNNLLLQRYSLTFLNATNSTLISIVNNILSSLRTQKQTNGGAINTIILTGTPAPTGGTSNADYVWLIANGVSVTLGTL